MKKEATNKHCLNMAVKENVNCANFLLRTLTENSSYCSQENKGIKKEKKRKIWPQPDFLICSVSPSSL